MAFYSGTATTINNSGTYIFGNTVFSSSTLATIADPSIVYNDHFGGSIAIANGRIYIGQRISSINTFGYGQIDIYDFNGNLLSSVTDFSYNSSSLFGYALAASGNNLYISSYGADVVYQAGANGNYVLGVGNFGSSNPKGFGYAIAAGCGIFVVTRPFDSVTSSIYGGFDIYDNAGNYINGHSGPQSAGLYSAGLGTAVAVGCGVIVVGAANYSDSATARTSGLTYVYNLYGQLLYSLGTPVYTYPNEMFGGTVAVGSGRIAVASANATVNSTYYAGYVHIFDLVGNWIGSIPNPLPGTYANFGTQIVIDSDRIAITAPAPSSNGGAVFIYTLNGDLINTITSTTSTFGTKMAMGYGKLVVSSSDYASSTGTVYVYNIDSTLGGYYDYLLDKPIY